MTKRQRNKKREKGIVLFVAIVVLVIVYAFVKKGMLDKEYATAIALYEAGQYDDAIEAFEAMGDFRESHTFISNAIEKKEKIASEIEMEELERVQEEESIKSRYNEAVVYFENGDYNKAVELFETVLGYEETDAYLEEARGMLELEEEYLSAVRAYNEGDYGDAIFRFEALGDYSDSEWYVGLCRVYMLRAERASAVSAGIRTSAVVNRDGTALYAGENAETGVQVNLWTDLISISAYGEYVLGLKKEGTVVVAHWTSDAYRVDTRDWSDIIDITTGEMFVAGLRKDGTLTAQGHNGDGQINIDDWTNVIDIDAGWRHLVGLRADGSIYIAGYGSKEQLEEIQKNAAQWNGVVAISAAGGENEYGYTIGLKADGHVVSVGANLYGRCDVDDWENVVAISAGDFFSVGITDQGKVVTTSMDERIKAQLENWEHIEAVSAGYNYVLGLNESGEILCAGYNRYATEGMEEWPTLYNVTN